MSVDAQQVEELKPRLLFFFESTDGFARRLEGYLAQVLQRRRNHETFLIHRIDVHERPDLAERFQIDQTPTICVVDQRRVAVRAHRPRSAQAIEELLAPWLRASRPLGE